MVKEFYGKWKYSKKLDAWVWKWKKRKVKKAIPYLAEKKTSNNAAH